VCGTELSDLNNEFSIATTAIGELTEAIAVKPTMSLK